MIPILQEILAAPYISHLLMRVPQFFMQPSGLYRHVLYLVKAGRQLLEVTAKKKIIDCIKYGHSLHGVSRRFLNRRFEAQLVARGCRHLDSA